MLSTFVFDVIDGYNEGEYDSALLGLPVGVGLRLLVGVFVGSLLGMKEGMGRGEAGKFAGVYCWNCRWSKT